MTAASPRRTPSRADRVRDGVAVGFLVLGTSGYLAAQRGMASLIVRRPYATLNGPEGGSNVEIWGRYWQLSRASLLFAGVGIATALWSFISHIRTPSTTDGQDDRS